MRDLTYFKKKIFPFNMSQQMTVTLTHKTQPAITENTDYYFDNNSLTRTIMAENMTVDREQAKILQDFYYEMEGSTYLFLVKDPFYDYSQHGFLGFGDDSQTLFGLKASLGGMLYDGIYAYTDGLEIYSNNILIPPTDYDLIKGQEILFHTPPETGAELTASFHYDFIMRFSDAGFQCIPQLKYKNYKINIYLI